MSSAPISQQQQQTKGRRRRYREVGKRSARTARSTHVGGVHVGAGSRYFVSRAK